MRETRPWNSFAHHLSVKKKTPPLPPRSEDREGKPSG